MTIESSLLHNGHERQNVILADCEPEEIQSFKDGCNAATRNEYAIISSVCNWGRAHWINNVARYAKYFTVPFSVFLRRKNYETILGWQQFYAINLAFYSRLFHAKKHNTIIAVNFTYKRKKGIIGRIYERYMKYCVNEHLDFLHVLSHNYAQRCSEELGVDINKFIVTNFGVPDIAKDVEKATVDETNYSLSIGRSNRDFDFLTQVWSKPCLKNEKLVIASDTWMPRGTLPGNVIHRNDITPADSCRWIKNCKVNVIPIADGNIASGDTVLLNGMMLARPTVITQPSTLAEMYIENGVDGICVTKDVQHAASQLSMLLRDISEMKRLGSAARAKFETHYSRQQMAYNLMTQISEHSPSNFITQKKK